MLHLPQSYNVLLSLCARPDTDNEMCNFYTMYYTENNGIPIKESECLRTASKAFVFPQSSEEVSHCFVCLFVCLFVFLLSFGFILCVCVFF